MILSSGEVATKRSVEVSWLLPTTRAPCIVEHFPHRNGSHRCDARCRVRVFGRHCYRASRRGPGCGCRWCRTERRWRPKVHAVRYTYVRPRRDLLHVGLQRSLPGSRSVHDDHAVRVCIDEALWLRWAVLRDVHGFTEWRGHGDHVLQRDLHAPESADLHDEQRLSGWSPLHALTGGLELAAPGRGRRGVLGLHAP
jgi:hypothetical protein